MSLTAVPEVPVVLHKDRLEVLFGELGELMGQRNVIDARIVEIAAEMDHGKLLGITGAKWRHPYEPQAPPGNN